MRNATPTISAPNFILSHQILLGLAGYLIVVWGWWTLYWRNPSGWGELGCGLAVLCGCVISVIGGMSVAGRTMS